MRKALFIINPISGVGRQKVLENLLPSVLDSSKIVYSIAYTSHKRHAEFIARDNSSTYDVIVAVGGDGTINEVASGIYGSNCAMAIIPTGSGNGLARFLKIPLQLQKSIKLIETGVESKIDVGFCNGKLFVNVGGVGFDAEIGHKFDQANSRGFLSYAKITLNELGFITTQKYTIRINGVELHEDALFVSFANSNQWGNDIKIAPLADIKDGRLELCIMRNIPILKAPFLALQLLSGNVHKSTCLKTISSDKIEIITNHQPLKYHLDGEPLICNENKLSIEVKPLSLNVIVP